VAGPGELMHVDIRWLAGGAGVAALSAYAAERLLPTPAVARVPVRPRRRSAGTGPRGTRPPAPRPAEAPAPHAPRPAPRRRPQPVPLSEEERRRRLAIAIDGLRESDPDHSAIRSVSKTQRWVVLTVIVVLILGAVLDLNAEAIALMTLSAAIYLTVILFRIRLFRLSTHGVPLHVVSDEDALAVPDDALPTYAVLVPAYHEPGVVERLLNSIGRLDYPDDKLEVKLLLEEDDTETVEAVASSAGADRFDVILVPAAEPRTKPKALNYGVQFCETDLITVYDAEDRPEPLQLRKAAVALGRAGPEIACLQAELAYFNPDQNIITRWFTVEYLMWFTQMLPGLSQLDAPVPLGGTSNHFRRQALVEVGGWDPFNVTEDADLGVRLHRRGYRTGILAATTMEEANSDFVNWARQRSRWYKGYLQTWLVHLRRPKTLWKDLGPKGFFQFNLFVGGTPIVALLNPIFWAMTILWFVGHPAGIKDIFPAPVYYASLLCWLAGNFMFTYANMLVVIDSDRDELILPAMLSPIYWTMMSIAAVKAAYQLVFQPSYWEKTFHGLDTPPPQQG
jgi:cellulose synthase/poly-beta-1,6-N-acetylglucosamine synthase-like glycosyltransferase